MNQESVKFKMYGALLIVTFIIFAMFLLTFTGNTATPTPTIGPTTTPGVNITPTPTRRPSPTPTRRITPTGRQRGTNWASTGAATNITATSATLHGSFSYEWEVFYGWFEYWETANPGAKKSTPRKTYLNYALNVSVTINNLNPDTQYTYVAKTDYVTGGEVSFTTLPTTATPTLAAASPTATPRPTPTMITTPNRTPTPTRRGSPTVSRRGWSVSTRPATNITATTATFSANVFSGGHQLTIWYEYWEAASPDVKMTTPSKSYLNITTIDYRDVSGLKPNTPYVYRVVARVSGYPQPLTVYMSQVSFTTLPLTTVTPTLTPGGYTVSYLIQRDWGTGATVGVTITNPTASAVNGWTLAFTFTGNQTIASLWSGTYTQSGATVTVKDAGSNATIPANGGSVNFGFNINYSGVNAKPASFILNGAACRVQ